MQWKHLISQQQLLEQLHDPSVVVLDCRFGMGSRDAGRQAYEAGHIPGAHYFDLDKDLAAPIGPHGGRHPLPDPEILGEKLRQAGVNDHSQVVVYDSQFGGMAARLWWLLHYYGHQQVKLLEGTFDQWQAAGHPVTTERTAPQSGTFQPEPQSALVATMDEVKKNIDTDAAVLIDAREAKRFLGIEEPIDPIAGHIPGARNAFWRETSDGEGRWHFSALKEITADLAPDHPVIVYCGSGVTACPLFLGLLELGFTNVRLYAGSWSDWITYPENPRVD